jgi:hypothetical protein
MPSARRRAASSTARVYASPACCSPKSASAGRRTLTLLRGDQRWSATHRRRPACRASRRPAAGGRHCLGAGALRAGRAVSEVRVRLAPDTDLGRLARGRADAAAAGAAAARRRTDDQRARLQPLARLPRQPQRAGPGRPADRRLPGLRHATHRRRAALDAVRAARRARPARRACACCRCCSKAWRSACRERCSASSSATRWPSPSPGCSAATSAVASSPAGTPVIVPQAPAGAGLLLLLGCAASLAGALYPAWLNRVQPLAQALKTGFAQQPHRLVRRGGAADGLRAARPAALADRRAGGADAVATALRPAAGRLCRDRPGAGLGIAAAPLLTQRFGLLFGRAGPPALPAPQRVAVQNVARRR